MSLFVKLSYVSRKRKLELFYKIMKPTNQTKVLDVGAEINSQDDHALQLIDSYRWKSKVVAVNISPQCITFYKATLS